MWTCTPIQLHTVLHACGKQTTDSMPWTHALPIFGASMRWCSIRVVVCQEVRSNIGPMHAVKCNMIADRFSFCTLGGEKGKQEEGANDGRRRRERKEEEEEREEEVEEEEAKEDEDDEEGEAESWTQCRLSDASLNGDLKVKGAIREEEPTDVTPMPGKELCAAHRAQGSVGLSDACPRRQGVAGGGGGACQSAQKIRFGEAAAAAATAAISYRFTHHRRHEDHVPGRNVAASPARASIA